MCVCVVEMDKKEKGQSKEIVPLFRIVPLLLLLNNKAPQKDKNQSNKDKEMNPVRQNKSIATYCEENSFESNHVPNDD